MSDPACPREFYAADNPHGPQSSSSPPIALSWCTQKGRPSNRPDGPMMLNTHSAFRIRRNSEFGGRLFVASDRPAAGKGGLGCGKAGDGNAEGRAGNVVHADLVAEDDAVGVAAVL